MAETYYLLTANNPVSTHAADHEKNLFNIGSSATTITSSPHPNDDGRDGFTFTRTESKNDNWANGTYKLIFNVTAAGADTAYGLLTLGANGDGHFARVNEAETTHLETKVQDEASFTGTGVKTASAVWDPAAGSTTDHFETCIATINNAEHGGTQDVTIEVDSPTASEANGGVAIWDGDTTGPTPFPPFPRRQLTTVRM